jgi:hypothetical protein
MIIFRYLFITIAILLIAWLLLALLVFFPALETVGQAYCSIPQAASRDAVQALLNNFKEKPSSIADIPEAYRSGLPAAANVFRYSYVLPIFSFYVLYDGNNKVLLKIPTYE